MLKRAVRKTRGAKRCVACKEKIGPADLDVAFDGKEMWHEKCLEAREKEDEEEEAKNDSDAEPAPPARTGPYNLDYGKRACIRCRELVTKAEEFIDEEGDAWHKDCARDFENVSDYLLTLLNNQKKPE